MTLPIRLFPDFSKLFRTFSRPTKSKLDFLICLTGEIKHPETTFKVKHPGQRFSSEREDIPDKWGVDVLSDYPSLVYDYFLWVEAGEPDGKLELMIKDSLL